MRKVILLPIVLLAMRLHGQAGTLDSDFGGDGIVTTSIGGATYGRAIALQTDGKILVAGGAELSTTDFAVARYFPDGSLDPSFSGDGVSTIGLSDTDMANAVAVQTDGKILLAGYYTIGASRYFAVARLNTDGSADSGFGLNGHTFAQVGEGTAPFEEEARAICLQPDGKILVAGSADNGTHNDFGLLRFNTNGALDESFSFDGKVVTSFGAQNNGANAIALDPNGHIVVAGYSNADIAVARYNADGQLDNTFGTNGKLTTGNGTGSIESGTAVQVTPEGKILVGGYSGSGFDSDFILVRYTSGGTLDPTFSSGGIATLQLGGWAGFASCLALQPDGKALLGGSAYTGLNAEGFAVARFTTSGALDNTFGTNGWLTTTINGEGGSGNAMALQANGRILVAGSRTSSPNTFAIARYLNDLDIGVAEEDKLGISAVLYPNPILNSATLRYELTTAAEVSCDLLDILGHRIRSLLGNTHQAPGEHLVPLGRIGLASGAYTVLLYTDREIRYIPVIIE